MNQQEGAKESVLSDKLLVQSDKSNNTNSPDINQRGVKFNERDLSMQDMPARHNVESYTALALTNYASGTTDEVAAHNVLEVSTHNSQSVIPTAFRSPNITAIAPTQLRS